MTSEIELATATKDEKTGEPAKSVADEWRASTLSLLTWGWMFPLIKLGYAQPLQESDIGDNCKRDEFRVKASIADAVCVAVPVERLSCNL